VVPRHYAPAAPVPIERLETVLELHDVDGAVLVQPSFLSTDNTYLLRCLARDPDGLRGVAVIDDGFDDAALSVMDGLGVIGIRFNLLGGGDLPDFSRGRWPRVLRALRRLRWHVELCAPGPRLPQLLPALQEADLPVVVDHFGLPDPTLGIDCTGFQHLLATADDDDGPWVKVSAPYRLGGLDPAPLIAALKKAHAMMVWGSDYPHTRFDGQVYASLLALAEPEMHDAAGALYGFS
jgi:predicted TIM-barrel fold metal-dependent hydrolase